MTVRAAHVNLVSHLRRLIEGWMAGSRIQFEVRGRSLEPNLENLSCHNLVSGLQDWGISFDGTFVCEELSAVSAQAFGSVLGIKRVC